MVSVCFAQGGRPLWARQGCLATIWVEGAGGGRPPPSPPPLPVFPQPPIFRSKSPLLAPKEFAVGGGSTHPTPYTPGAGGRGPPGAQELLPRRLIWGSLCIFFCDFLGEKCVKMRFLCFCFSAKKNYLRFAPGELDRGGWPAYNWAQSLTTTGADQHQHRCALKPSHPLRQGSGQWGPAGSASISQVGSTAGSASISQGITAQGWARPTRPPRRRHG